MPKRHNPNIEMLEVAVERLGRLIGDVVFLGGCATHLKVGRLGISSSFGAPAAAYEAAFERGCNYFT